MTAIEIKYHIDQYVTRLSDPEDRWDRDDTAGDITIQGINIVDKASYKDIDVPIEVTEGEIYYLLWADYNTGDSFGHDGNQFEAIDLFTTSKAAYLARRQLLAANKSSGIYTRDDGTNIQIYLPWEGYFESLNDLNVTEVIADDCRRR